MKKQLEETSRKRRELEGQLAEAVEAEERARRNLVTGAGKGLFLHIRSFADSFKSGHTRELYDKVQASLTELEGLDPDYMGVLAGSDPYGESGTEEVRFLVSYLLGGKWIKDSYLWDVLDKVAELRSQPGNIFLNENERR